MILARRRDREPRPLIWLSAAESYDPAARGSAPLRSWRGENTTFYDLGGAFRFGAPLTAVLHWRAGHRATGIHPNSLRDIDRKRPLFDADPDLWYVHVGNMRLSRIVAVQVAFDDEGKDWNDDERLSESLERWHERYRREREKRAPRIVAKP